MPTTKLFAALLVAATLFLTFAPVRAQDKPDAGNTTAKSDAKAERDSEDAEDAEVDPYALYKKVGRNWTFRSGTKFGDMDESVSYFKYEITEVADDYAMQTMTLLDSDKKPVDFMEPQETKIPFNTPDIQAPENPDMQKEDTTITLLGKKWDAILITTTHSELTTRSWSSKEYPGLLLKMETTGKSSGMDFESTYELIEFSELESASAAEGDSAASDEADPYVLYKKVGRTWTHKSTTTIEGMDPMVSYIKYEITEVEDDHCIQKMTMLDKDKKPFPMDPTEVRIEFKVAERGEGVEAPEVEVKEETVTVTAGEFECYFTDMNGTKAWSSRKYPGLLVKMEGATMTMELIEFTE